MDRNLSVKDVIEELRNAFLSYGSGRSKSSPRDRIFGDGMVLNTMPALYADRHMAGLKTYIAGKGGARFVVLVFDTDSMELMAVIEANRLGQVRTGALPAMFTREAITWKPKVFTVIGSGFQAETQLTAMCSVFQFEEVRVYSRHPENARKFAERMSKVTGLGIEPFSDVHRALRDTDIVNSITDSNEAIFSRGDLPDRYIVNLAGGNLPNRREAAPDVLEGSELIVVEHLEQALLESGEVIDYVRKHGRERLIELKDFMVKPEAYRKDRVVFKSMGIGLEDLAAAYVLLRKMGVTGDS
ncbi:ornithine cyclodeaminase [Thermogymnomonas acidicola]|uniref:Ornithine cyclodeaminase n=1 Tax=Thermogymnomonas acidicola TaxID=399579 RepID=A0AA37F963_9ARCH|nr:ornithine cyclodeaminase [Thermogymnomonas acidicola]